VAFLIVAGAAGTWAIGVPAYSAARPERRVIRYTHDLRSGRAWLQVAGAEPIGPGDLTGGPSTSWKPDTSTPAIAPVAVRSDIPPLSDPVPATVSAKAEPLGPAESSIRVAVHATETTLVTILGESHLVPTNTDAVVSVRVFGGAPRELPVTLTTAAIHDGSPTARLPEWVSTDHTAWRALSTFVTTVTVN
jgi:hypothetical protein